MWTRRWMWILWPAFLCACVLEALVFSLVDPVDLHWFGQPLALSRPTAYALAFFAFWTIAALSGATTVVLSMSRRETNRCPPLASGNRPGCGPTPVRTIDQR